MGSLAVGVVLTILAVATELVLIIYRTRNLEAAALGVLVGAAGVMIAWRATLVLRNLRRNPSVDPVPLAPPYAFRIRDGVIEFPSSFESRPDEWPIADCQVVATERWLKLRCPGHHPRRFHARALQLTPIEVASLVSERVEATRGARQ